jgi:GxxExxY protein
MELTKSYLKDLTYKVTGAAIEVHKRLGPGLLESVYHKCLEKELELRGIKFVSEYKIPYYYKGFDLDIDFRCDFWVEDIFVVEIKSCDEVAPIHIAKLMNYMNLLQSPKGLMINFNVINLYQEGQKTYVNDLYYPLQE